MWKEKNGVTVFIMLMFILAVVSSNHVNANAMPETHKIALVIDDFGNGMKGTDEMMKLDIPLTVAVMPFLPTTKEDAERAHREGHEVIIHLPMEPVHGKPSWLGPGAITTELSDDEIRNRVEKAIEDVPHAVGINNHMGSKATADSRVMSIVMEVCRKHGLFFLDSATTAQSKAQKTAATLGVPLLRNNLFLDDVYTAGHVQKQIRKLIKQAKKRESMIVIGHVGPPGHITAEGINGSKAELQAVAEFVFLSDLVPSLDLPRI